MPTFDTPGPISVTINLGAGDARIRASDRSDTVVQVRPTDSASDDDVRAADETRVEYADGSLLVKAPRLWRRFSPFSEGGSVDVAIELPAGSRLQGDTAMAALRCEGRLGDCRFKTAAGDLQFAQTGELNLSTAAGDIRVDRAAGRTDITTASGEVRVREIDGSAVIKNSNGDIWIGEVTGDLRSSAANGDITVGQAHATATAKTANGNVRIGEVTRGSVLLETAFGDVEIGIREGTAARLDVRTHYGAVRNDMDASEGPGPSGETAEVRARTGFGDILIHRA